jgi:hypothetical protein
MTLKFLPYVLAGVLIVGLTFVEAGFSDRWHDSSVDAAEFGKLFDRVPMDIGSWHGEDLDVEEDVRRTAGAVSYVSRRYTEENTDRWVTLWLIVGHSRDVCRHTPNICYPNAGFKQNSSILKHHLSVAGGEEAVFYTAKFEKADEMSRHIERVFWTWNHPERDRWEAPDNQRREYGNSRALYKLYFTSSVMKDEDTIEDSVAVEFAEQMVPLINAALFGGESQESLESRVEDIEISAPSDESLESLESPELGVQSLELGESLELEDSLEVGVGAETISDETSAPETD